MLFQAHVDLALFDDDRIGSGVSRLHLDEKQGRFPQVFSGPHVKPGPVAGATDHGAFQDAIRPE